ncbi:hypothetical protein [Neptuniibacter pectenicola]|jgi:hypothetical protein|uniref:hypothetical protein n=1 Tax=Neptuniibacter pectenicola TaxID=1806669 RepID=UPI003EEB2BA2
MGQYLACLLLFVTTSSMANIYWQPIKQDHSGGHGRQAKQFQLKGEQPALNTTIEFIHSDLESAALEQQDGIVTLKPTGKNNYHALIARQTSADFQGLAVRYIYNNGRPVNTSPSDLLALELGGLQITPSPLPREHWEYESLKTYYFKVMLNGRPLANHPLLATTALGSNKVVHTGEGGVVALLIPEDFPTITPQRRATPPAELQLFSSLEKDGITYETSFTSAYHASETSWKSVSLGAGVAFAGLLFGFVVNRRLPEHSRRKAK